MGVPNVLLIFDDAFYERLEGGVMGAFAKLFDGNTKLFVYPLGKDNEILTADTLYLSIAIAFHNLNMRLRVS